MKITLCGSTRFMDAFNEWNVRLTECGHVVYSVCRATTQQQTDVTPEKKEILDRVHKQKIDASDAILVLNYNGYIGDSTRSEIAHAKAAGKRIFYWFPYMVGGDTMRDGERVCPYAGCVNPLSRPPCALCYE